MRKHQFERKKVIRTIRRAVYFFVALAIERRINYLYYIDGKAEMKYPYQGAVILLCITGLLLVLAIRKMIPKSLTDAIKGRIAWAYKTFIQSPMAKLAKKLRKLFGLPESQRVKGKDEKSFIFDLENLDIFRRFQSVKNQLRWKDLKTNAEKIRFIYIKYVITLIKKGYPFKAVRTPNEVCDELNLQDDPKRLFELYNDARYSGGAANIADEEVETSMKLVKKGGKM